MTPSGELRLIIQGVKDGKVTVEQATGGIARWMVEAISTTQGTDLGKLVREAAEHERAACIEVVITTGDVPIVKLKSICERIEARPVLRHSEER